MEKNEKKWIKVPWTTIALQAGLLVFCGIFVQFQFDIYVFGVPLESFLVMWCPYIFVAVATTIYIIKERKKEDE
ncbi:hypothetical protein [Enterocloster asparagiformis]|uniref:hypothetical protein n=1 Tax=Enterocloster asparagiformis TaxID=333367 RepID=UPI000466C304|nr:hypothetical protein [Enterocloster asparagiformis]